MLCVCVCVEYGIFLFSLLWWRCSISSFWRGSSWYLWLPVRSHMIPSRRNKYNNCSIWARFLQKPQHSSLKNTLIWFQWLENVCALVRSCRLSPTKRKRKAVNRTPFLLVFISPNTCCFVLVLLLNCHRSMRGEKKKRKKRRQNISGVYEGAQQTGASTFNAVDSFTVVFLLAAWLCGLS